MNTPEDIKIGKSREVAALCNYKTLQILSEQDDGTMLVSELRSRLAEQMTFDDWALHEYVPGRVRWVVVFYFYSVDLVKSGYLQKNNGVWCITAEGRDALARHKSEPFHLFKETQRLYKEWKKKNKAQSADEAEAIDDPASFVLESVKQQANDDLRAFIKERTPYEFQDMVAAILRAMGYYTPFIAPKGKDGGIDVIAYSDPLGATKPILKVQVKHYDISNPVPVDVIHNIIGVAKGDTPIVVTSGRFTEDARTTARQNNVRLIDGTEFIELWIEYYPKMSESDKALMPIEPVFFVRRTE